MRVALASTLHELFLYGAAILLLALIASVFLDDVPFRSRKEVEAARAATEVAV